LQRFAEGSHGNRRVRGLGVLKPASAGARRTCEFARAPDFHKTYTIVRNNAAASPIGIANVAHPRRTPVKSTSAQPLEIIEQLFSTRGQLQYGENVSQIEHALQCAALAEQAGADDELIVAAMLHDIGHLLHRDAAGALRAGADDAHESLGAKFLAGWFGPGISGPVALHVQAKRFLCTREAGYHDRLSSCSRRSLEIQGGPMSGAQAAAFEKLDYAAGGVLVRRWDDLGKQAGLATPSLTYFMAIVERHVQPG
jgi:phosphonate degradation associated HDIG domain protein